MVYLLSDISIYHDGHDTSEIFDYKLYRDGSINIKSIIVESVSHSANITEVYDKEGLIKEQTAVFQSPYYTDTQTIKTYDYFYEDNELIQRKVKISSMKEKQENGLSIEYYEDNMIYKIVETWDLILDEDTAVRSRDINTTIWYTMYPDGKVKTENRDTTEKNNPDDMVRRIKESIEYNKNGDTIFKFKTITYDGLDYYSKISEDHIYKYDNEDRIIKEIYKFFSDIDGKIYNTTKIKHYHYDYFYY
jgi:hypothetical protein